MRRYWHLTTALAAMLALSTSTAEAGRGDGIALNGPALDGHAAALPGGLSVDSASETQFFGDQCPPWTCGQNGPALDGRRVEVPAGPSVGDPSEGKFFEGCPRWGCGQNGPALDGRKATPDLARLAIEQVRLPGDSRGIVPADHGWPISDQDQRIQQ